MFLFLLAFTYANMDHLKANISDWLECTVLKVYTLIHHWYMQHFFKILEYKVTCCLIFEVCTVVLIKMQVFRHVRPCHLSS